MIHIGEPLPQQLLLAQGVSDQGLPAMQQIAAHTEKTALVNPFNPLLRSVALTTKSAPLNGAHTQQLSQQAVSGSLISSDHISVDDITMAPVPELPPPTLIVNNQTADQRVLQLDPSLWQQAEQPFGLQQQQGLASDKPTAAVNENTSLPNPLDRVVAHQVTQQLIKSVGDQQRVLTIRLTPPELGTVKVQVAEQAGGVLKVTLQAEDDGVRAALERSLPHMRQELRHQDSMVRDINLPTITSRSNKNSSSVKLSNSLVNTVHLVDNQLSRYKTN